jgi:DNA-binding MarR family transcriptional regulator/N-acetylglutamate synthase-like GNAT family acetyltransferase
MYPRDQGSAVTAHVTAATDLDRRIAAVRRFNRFYTRQIGLLRDGVLDSPFSLAEARVLYELGQHGRLTATQLAGALGLDQGYLSRILRRFADRNLIAKTASPDDGRQILLVLTASGRSAFRSLDRGSHDQVGAMLAKLPHADQERIVAAMGAIGDILGERNGPRPAYVLRPPRPGEFGWVVARHGAVYTEALGWDTSFEGLVAEIVAAFIKNFDPQHERCWIAEIDGEPVGCVFLVRKSDTVAMLRLLLVEPKARGHGIGARLVEECIRFARSAGYTTIALWTQSILIGARRIYERAGFRRIAEDRHTSFGRDLVGETWERKL